MDLDYFLAPHMPGDHLLARYAKRLIVLHITTRPGSGVTSAVFGLTDDDTIAIKVAFGPPRAVRPEVQLHYYLTQLDVPETREQAVGSDRFVATAENRREWEKHLHVMLLSQRTEKLPRNIVPLYDFEVGGVPRYEDLLPDGTDDQKALLAVKMRLPTEGSTQVMMRFPRTLQEHMRSLGSYTPLERVLDCRSALAQIMCTLHQLMAIAFTHGDLRPENVAVLECDEDAMFKLFSDRYVRVPRARPNVALLDFGMGNSAFRDATGSAYQISPTTGRIFAPAVDIFRLSQLMLYLLWPALTTLEAGADDTVSVSKSDEAAVFFAALGDIMKKCNVEDDADVTALMRICEKLAHMSEWEDDDFELLKTNLPSPDDGFKRLKPALEALSVRAQLLPWDVLVQLRVLEVGAIVAPDRCMHPVYNKGKIYDPRGMLHRSNEEARTRPLPSKK